MEIGNKVIVSRQIGKSGIPVKSEGVIKRFSSIMTVKGKPTALIVFDDDKNGYFFPVDEIEIVR